MAKKKQSEAEMQHAETMTRLEHRFELCSQAIRVVLAMVYATMYGVIAWLTYLSIEALAGKDTEALILADVKIGWAVSLTAGFAGYAYARRERRLRKTTVQRLQARIRSLEQQIAPGRSTSNLTDMGNTNPEDK